MKINTLQSQLNSALKLVSRFISTRPQLPILSSVYISAKSGAMTLIATDLQLGISHSIKADVIEEGTAVVSAKTLSDLVSTLSGKIELSTSDEAVNSITITSGLVKSDIPTYSSLDYPPFPQAEGETLILPTQTVIDATKLVGFAASKDEARPVLSAIFFDFEQNAIVATDGVRLSLLSNQLKSAKDQKIKNFIIPVRSIEEMIRVCLPQEKEIKLSISLNSKQVFFDQSQTQMVLRTIEGEFPDYQPIIPQDFSTSVTVACDQLLHQLKSAMIFSKEGSGVVELEIGEDQLQIKSASTVSGSYVSNLNAKTSGKLPLKIAFNGKYLIEYLSQIDSDVTFKASDPLRPVLFSAQKFKDHIYVVMPFRLTQ